MAITGALTIQTTDFSTALSGIVSACSPNVLKVDATLSGGTDADAYITIALLFQNGVGYTFKLINLDFDGTSGNFYFDFSDILPYAFTDISDDELTSGVQTVTDTFISYVGPFYFVVMRLYDSSDNILDTESYDGKFLFSSKQLGNPDGSNEVDWAAHQSPNFIAQKNKQSYVYHYGKGTITFEKINRLPIEQTLIDYEVVLMDDSELLINTI